MKKNLLFAIFCIAFSSVSFGQLKIVQPGDTNNLNDSTIIVYGNATDEMNNTLNVINTGIDSLKVYARRDSIYDAVWMHLNNQFCWVLCYDTNSNNLSAFTETLNKRGTSGDTSNPSFAGHYWGEGHVGIAKIRYTFFSARNPADSSWVIVEYDATPTGIPSISGKTLSFSAYPNPAGNYVNFSYNLLNSAASANLKIYNMLGECIQTLPLNTSKNKITLDVQSISSGVYVCEVEANGCQPAYQKLIITH